MLFGPTAGEQYGVTVRGTIAGGLKSASIALGDGVTNPPRGQGDDQHGTSSAAHRPLLVAPGRDEPAAGLRSRRFRVRIKGAVPLGPPARRAGDADKVARTALPAATAPPRG